MISDYWQQSARMAMVELSLLSFMLQNSKPMLEQYPNNINLICQMRRVHVDLHTSQDIKQASWSREPSLVC